MELHENIRALRKARGWSQQQLAERVGYGDRSSIAKIEAGKVDLPRSKIAEFARVFDVTPAYLMGYSEETDALLVSIAEDNKSGRTAAVEELRRTYGTEHSIHSTYSCDDKKRVTLLYYKTLERDVALSLTDIISTVDHLDGRRAEKGHASPPRLPEGRAAYPQHRGYRAGSLCGRFRRSSVRRLSDRVIEVDFRKK